MRAKGKGQPQRRGKLRPADAGAENKDRHVGILARHGAHRLARRGGAQIRQQLLHVARKGFHVARHAAERLHGRGIGIDTPPQPQVDAPRMQRRQRAELFGHHQRHMVRQHDAACPDTDGACGGRDMADHHGGGGPGDAGGVVMLDQPVTAIAQTLGLTRKLHRLAEGGRGVTALLDGHEIMNGKRRHEKTCVGSGQDLAGKCRDANRCEPGCHRPGRRAPGARKPAPWSAPDLTA